LIEAKFNKSQALLDHLKLRYPEVKFDVSDQLIRLRDIKRVSELMGMEGTLAGKY
jgi:CRISPR-associated protein Cas1